MNFTTNYENIGSGSELLPVGKYECIVRDAVPAATKNGTPYLDIRFVIRNDVQQKYQNKYIFHSIWKKKEPSEQDKQTDNYSFKQLMNLANAVKLPSGKNYASVAELCKDFAGKCCNVEIEHKKGNDGKMRERVTFCNQTAYPECKHVFKTAGTQQVNSNTHNQQNRDAFSQPASAQQPVDLSDFEEINTDDIPF